MVKEQNPIFSVSSSKVTIEVFFRLGFTGLPRRVLQIFQEEACLLDWSFRFGNFWKHSQHWLTRTVWSPYTAFIFLAFSVAWLSFLNTWSKICRLFHFFLLVPLRPFPHNFEKLTVETGPRTLKPTLKISLTGELTNYFHNKMMQVINPTPQKFSSFN